MEDAMIVSLYWQRDEAAIAHTQEKYDAYLHKIAYNVLNDSEDSRESVNDTYLAAWNSMPPHKPEILSTYLGKLTRRISIDLFRKRTRLKRGASEYTLSLSELADCIPGGATPESELELKQLGQTISAFLRTLSADARNTFIGRYYYMDPLKEVARYCGMSESKAKTLLYRTRQALRTYLEKEGYFL
ncbi:MAG: sigma-70 family RNA polymerase sigma factor [Oscillospiraceae bacterium]|nr:sigma-70 family RNA polymerase sigma factor [Oscillospiraceae bacterium]